MLAVIIHVVIRRDHKSFRVSFLDAVFWQSTREFFPEGFLIRSLFIKFWWNFWNKAFVVILCFVIRRDHKSFQVNFLDAAFWFWQSTREFFSEDSWYIKFCCNFLNKVFLRAHVVLIHLLIRRDHTPFRASFLDAVFWFTQFTHEFFPEGFLAHFLIKLWCDF